MWGVLLRYHHRLPINRSQLSNCIWGKFIPHNQRFAMTRIPASDFPASGHGFSYFVNLNLSHTCNGTCGLSVTTFFHQVLNYYYLTVYIMFKPKMSLWDLPKTEEEAVRLFQSKGIIPTEKYCKNGHPMNKFKKKW